MLSLSIDTILTEIEQLDLSELVQLSKFLQEKWSVSATSATTPAEAATSKKEQTEFDIILTEIGPHRISVIKAVYELTRLGLREAKAIVDEAPKPIKKAVSKEEAQCIANKMAEVGAKVTIEFALTGAIET